jgi:hypothetical protein
VDLQRHRLRRHGYQHLPARGAYNRFRFYKANIETTYPCMPKPGCPSDDHQIRSKNDPDDGVTYYAN